MDSSSLPSADAEAKFLAENGMTLSDALTKVKDWRLAGREEEMRSGIQRILRYFPDHEIKNLLVETSVQTHDGVQHILDTHDQPGGGAAKSAPEESKKSIAEKLGEVFEKEVEERIDAKKQADTEAKNSEPAQETPPSASEKKSSSDTDEIYDDGTPVLEDERIFATIGYAWIFCLIPLLLKKESKFVQFHAKQGLIMALILTAFDFTIGALLNSISGGFGFFLKMIYIGLLGYAAFNAYKGKYWKVPVVYGLSQKINF